MTMDANSMLRAVTRPAAFLMLSWIVALSGCALPHSSSNSTEPRLQGRTVEEWCELLEPDASMRAWQQVPWETTFHAGAEAAAQAKKPLLLWLMNGHPLGCT